MSKIREKVFNPLCQTVKENLMRKILAEIIVAYLKWVFCCRYFRSELSVCFRRNAVLWSFSPYPVPWEAEHVSFLIHFML